MQTDIWRRIYGDKYGDIEIFDSTSRRLIDILDGDIEIVRLVLILSLRL